ncbi:MULTISPECIES: hypothetical protein [unclassified Granulicatella]|uniref:hypothetical protein n=1 Tax=unclassified Granulicatella TaxID=2630493 RepID=UPI001073C53D|nr:MULTISPECIES: hypothetical protein [unclassified Granulicatella]MBF0780766.1 hypothetical protein [Granulicatella sp. 19428wC4_WM01]TFU93887.1 hypothetical protein E4T68_06600 [Granulicatella sp. WM01]
MKKIINSFFVLILLLGNVISTARVVSSQEIGRVDTSISYSTEDTTYHEVDQFAQYKMSVTVSERTYDGSYSLIKVPKNKFRLPKSEDISDAVTIKNTTITENDTHYIIRFDYNRISEAEVRVPFNLFLKNQHAYDGEELLLETEYYDHNNTLIAAGQFNPIAKAKLARLGDYNGFRRLYSNNGNIPVEYNESFYVSFEDTGTDSRSYGVIMTLPEGIVFNLKDNPEWLYDETTRVIRSRPDSTFSETLKFSYEQGKYSIPGRVELNTQVFYYNPDGSMTEPHNSATITIEYKEEERILTGVLSKGISDSGKNYESFNWWSSALYLYNSIEQLEKNSLERYWSVDLHSNENTKPYTLKMLKELDYNLKYNRC